MRLSVLLLGLLTGACASLVPGEDAIKVTLSNIRVVDATLLEQVYDVTLRVQNRTERDLSLEGGHFDLALNGADFGSGVSDRHVVVPAYSDAMVEVRMIGTLFGWVRLIRGLEQRRGEPLRYEISGRFSVSGFPGVGFRESGEIGLPSAPPPPGGLPAPGQAM